MQREKSTYVHFIVKIIRNEKLQYGKDDETSFIINPTIHQYFHDENKRENAGKHAA